MTANEPANQREIDWSTAEVRDAELRVGLTGGPSKPWRKRFEAVIDRLEQTGNAWGEVRPTKRRIKVAGLVEGREAELRHLLDAAVQQTNADFVAEASEAPDDVSDGDRRMTDAFRAGVDAEVSA
jgi:hypothetical protein